MKRPLSPAEMYPAGMPEIETRTLSLATGVRVRVAERGPTNGRPVILLHGWGASLYMFRHAFERLPRYGLRAIAVDLRGYGLSDKPRRRGAYTLDAYTADLDALYDSLAVEQAALVGHSMGGALALRYASQRPQRVRRLVLINPAALVPIMYPAFARIAPRALLGLLGGRLVPRSVVAFILRRIAYGDASLVTERDIDEYWAPTRLPGFVYAAHAALREFGWRPIADAEAAALRVPSAVIIGRDDRLIRRSRTRAEKLHGAAVRELVGGHSVHEERPDEAYAIIGEFVR